MKIHQRPRDALDARALFVMLREQRYEQISKILEYAEHEFRAGNSVLYCHDAGHPVVRCATRGELLAAIGVRHVPRPRGN